MVVLLFLLLTFKSDDMDIKITLLVAALVSYIGVTILAPFMMLVSVILSHANGQKGDGTGEWLILFSFLFAIGFIVETVHLTLANL